MRAGGSMYPRGSDGKNDQAVCRNCRQIVWVDSHPLSASGGPRWPCLSSQMGESGSAPRHGLVFVHTAQIIVGMLRAPGDSNTTAIDRSISDLRQPRCIC